MKIIEQSDKRIWISSEAALWLKAILWCFSLAILSLLYLAESTADYLLSIIGALFFYLVPTSIAETIFDIENNKVYARYRIFGINLRNLEVPLDSARLISQWKKQNLILYLFIAPDMKYRIGNLWSVDERNVFISNLLKVVPIEHYQRI